MLDKFNNKNFSCDSLNYVEPKIFIKNILTNKNIEAIEEFDGRVF